MLPTQQGSFRLFRFLGVEVFLHWSWFIIAFIQISRPITRYSSSAWNIFEYLALFLIVLLHEYGHALACRQVGGRADKIVLWPLGGVAYVSPPQRPGPVLWSIAAGPLVNVILFPVFILLVSMSESSGWISTQPDLHRFLVTLSKINLILLIFNLLPVYPLDGGQILRSLLWFFLGPARSLMAATVLGFLAVLAFTPYVISSGNIWLYIIIAFVLMNCWRGFQQARFLGQMARAPRRAQFACPACKTAPLVGEFWTCGKCRNAFDLFAHQAQCPHCGVQYSTLTCQECGRASAINDWLADPAVPPKI